MKRGHWIKEEIWEHFRIAFREGRCGGGAGRQKLGRVTAASGSYGEGRKFFPANRLASAMLKLGELSTSRTVRMLIVMETKPVGRSAILQRKIDKLQREIELVAHFPQTDPSHEADKRLRELAALHDELEREGKTKRVIILATEHGCQLDGNAKNGALAQRLSLLIERFAVTVLMEEWSERKGPSFASRLESCVLSYSDVGTPSEEQFYTYRLPINHPDYVGTLDDCGECPYMSEYGPLDRQENRERKMLQNIQTAMERHQVGLFLVGLGHLHSMSNKLLAANFNVTAFEWLG